MEKIFRFIVNNVPACVFGGAVLDMLCDGKIGSNSDIDIFVTNDTARAETITLLTRFLQFVLGAKLISVNCVTTFDYEIASPRPWVIWFSFDDDSEYRCRRHIDIVKLAEDAPKNVDFDVNSLYIENCELKTLLPDGNVDEICKNIRTRVMRQIFFPTNQSDPALTQRFFHRQQKMQKKGFILDRVYPETKAINSLIEICRLDPYIPMENFLRNCYIVDTDAIFFYYAQRLPTNFTVVANEEADLFGENPLQLQWKNNKCYYSGGCITRVTVASVSTQVGHLQYSFNSKSFSSLLEETVPFAKIESILTTKIIEERNSSEFLYRNLGFRFIQ